MVANTPEEIQVSVLGKSNRTSRINLVVSFVEMLMCHQSLVETLEVQDVEAFTDAVKAYDSISRLDPWYSTHIHRNTQVRG